jgi:hypothetical protein
VITLNHDVADRLDEAARLLAEQGANPFRVRAYRRASRVLRTLPRPVDDLLREGGSHALEALPGIGDSLARSIAQVVVTGRLPMLDRLRGESNPVDLLATVPGIGRRTAERLHHDLGIETLEELEVAAHDGRIETVALIGPKRLAGVRAALAQRLSRPRRETSHAMSPTVSEILDVDREYRLGAEAGTLPMIAPRRFNPAHEPWLPVLHTQRRGCHYTAMFSNTPRAHRLEATRDWVIVYLDDPRGDGQWTVITARWGPLAGRRLVRGREAECARHYGATTAEAVPLLSHSA